MRLLRKDIESTSSYRLPPGIVCVLIAASNYTPWQPFRFILLSNKAIQNRKAGRNHNFGLRVRLPSRKQNLTADDAEELINTDRFRRWKALHQQRYSVVKEHEPAAAGQSVLPCYV